MVGELKMACQSVKATTYLGKNPAATKGFQIILPKKNTGLYQKMVIKSIIFLFNLCLLV